MLFNSFTFLVFFALVLAIHVAHLPWKIRKLNLLVASYLFYAAWNPPFVILLWISTIADWQIARRLHRTRDPRGRRAWVIASLAVNLGLLGYFKYGGFVLDNFLRLAAAAGIELRLAAPSIILPVGISFYTFQTLSYTLDVARRKMKPSRSFLDYAMYVAFFPQLVAGPIVRAGEFLPQCRTSRRATQSQFGWGLALLILGLFEKTVVADGLLAPVAEKVFDPNGVPGFFSAWCGTFAFSGQIFCDFAGYSTCAIGIALCLGFHLPDNFRFPYAASGFSDFWRRWHISLSTWLRDYLYIPLGGNRHGGGRTLANLAITMLLGGLWHGASWTFVAWGALHGLYLVVERMLQRIPRPTRLRPGILRAGVIGGTFLAVTVAWVLFRARSFADAARIYGAMTFLNRGAATTCVDRRDYVVVGLAIAAILAFHALLRDTSLERTVARIPWWVRGLVLAAMLFALATCPGEDRAFIYFQF